MESKFQLTVNGQQLQQQDVNHLGEISALADDRVIAELFRLKPLTGSTVSRGILRYGVAESQTAPTVSSGTGGVNVFPFRAIIGSRTAASTDGLAHWRDVRSGISLAEGVTSNFTAVALASNVSGNPRWDLVYAAVTLDSNGASVTRKIKDPVTKAIAAQSVVTTLVTLVTLAVVTGTAAVSPLQPAIPADAGGTYYIPLAYVRVPNGFGVASFVPGSDIIDAAPALWVAPPTGGSSTRPVEANTAVSSAQAQAWGSSGTPTETFLPPSMTGSESLLIAVKCDDMADGFVLDNGYWLNRITRFTAGAGSGSFPWVSAASTGVPNAENRASGFAAGSNHVVYGLGQTFRDDDDPGGAPENRAYAAYITGANITDLGVGNNIGVYCDLADGQLKLRKTGTTTGIYAFFWVEFSAPRWTA